MPGKHFSLPQGEAAFLIGLQRTLTGRGAHIQKLWRESGLEPQWWEGVDGAQRMVLHSGEKLSFEYQKYFVQNVQHGKRGYYTSAIGCYLAHYRLWRHCLEKGYRRVLILEDDAAPRSGLHKIWDELLSLEDSFEVVKLYFSLLPPYLRSEPVRSHYALRHFSDSKAALYRPFDLSYCTTAYLATRGALQKLVARAMPVAMPVDYYLDRFEIHGARVFIVMPLQIHLLEVESSFDRGKKGIPPSGFTMGIIKARRGLHAFISKVLEVTGVMRRIAVVLRSPSGEFYPNRKVPPHLFWQPAAWAKKPLKMVAFLRRRKR